MFVFPIQWFQFRPVPLHHSMGDMVYIYNKEGKCTLV